MTSDRQAPDRQSLRALGFDLAPLILCSLIWGTTWFAITWQLGVVPAVVSIVYRFGLAAAILFLGCVVARWPIRMTLAQHRLVAGQGVFIFGINYACVYLAEARIASAVVAMLSASLAFVNLAMFRLVLKHPAARGAWVAATLGLLGVGVMSWAEIRRVGFDGPALSGIALGTAAVFSTAIGNIFAQRAQGTGVGLVASTAWGMTYGAGLLALAAVVTGQPWLILWTPHYIGSLLYLAVLGSVVAFMLYYTLARRRGFTVASYISTLVPPIAILVSGLFEHATWGIAAVMGVGLVVAGQILLIRLPRPVTPA